MRLRLIAFVACLSSLAVGCSPPDDDVPTVAPPETGADTGPETSEVDAGSDAAPGDADTAPGRRRVVFTGKDPAEAVYRLETTGTVTDETSVEPGDSSGEGVVEGRIGSVGERDVYTVTGRIRSLEAEGNIEAKVAGEIRRNGPKLRAHQARGGGPTVGMTIHASVELLKANGRASERAVATYAARAFEEAGFGYRIIYNLFPQRPPDEKSNCSAGDAPQWWGRKVRKNWRRTTTFAGEEPSIELEEDSNILMLNANGGGCGAIGGNYGTTPAGNIDEVREWKPVGSGDWQRNIHGTLHEIGHQLGARHDHDESQPGAQHPGSAWNETGPEGKTWWHRTPTTAGNGAPNRCGAMIKKRQTQPNVRRHQTYANCAIRLFDIKENPDGDEPSSGG